MSNEPFDREEFKRHEELDFLDQCAIAAMGGMVVIYGVGFHSYDVVVRSYNLAEAMLAERTKRRACRAN